MTLWRSFLLVLLLAGCGNQPLPAPSITGVQPTMMVASQPTEVSVQVDVQLPTTIDYAAGTIAIDAGMHVFVGTQELGTGTYPPDGLVRGTLPTVIPTGTYNVTVVLPDNRSAVQLGAFKVTPGLWPTSYTVDPIGVQRSRIPFQVTLRAHGPNGPSFGGNVLLGVSTGASLVPPVSNAFSSGALIQSVTVIGAGTVTLQVSDIAGNIGQSPPFNVQP